MRSQLTQELGINYSTLTADLRELAWLWEDLVARLDYCTFKLAAAILFSLVKAYMRGRGFKTGNFQGFRRHSLKYTLLVRSVVELVVNGGSFYESLQNVGFNSVDRILPRLREG